MKPLATAWAEFEARVIPKDASRIQCVEMKRAFYAGAYSMLMMQHEIAAHDYPNGMGVAALQSWYDECVEFYQQVSSGEA